MNEQQKFEKRKQRTKIILITISVLFMIVMLVLPLFSVITNSLSEGFKFYVSSISTEYVRSALFVTILATLVAVTINTFFGIMAAFLLTKFSFKGKQVLATLIDIPFSISPVIVGLAFLMTFGRLGWTYPAIRAINLLWNEYPDRICDSRSHFSNHFRDLPICVKGDYTDLKLTGKRRRRGSSIDGSQWIYDLSKDHTSSDEMGIDLWDHLM